MNEIHPNSRPVAGDTVDNKYKLVRLLGEGGFGVVFEAKHLSLDDKVALKFYLPKKGHSAMERERFLREGPSARRIKSEYSVHVSDMGTFTRVGGADEILYIVMEHLEGMDLHDYIETHHPLPITTCIDFIFQACIALAKAHAMNIFHRDLKPSNLFLTEQDGLPRVKVLDFGLVKDRSPGVSPKAPQTQEADPSIGTPNYSPPEQYFDFQNPTPASDIFSLAASLYFILANADAFPGSSHVAIALISYGQPVPMRSVRYDIPQELVDVIEKALAKKANDRYASIVEFAEALVPFGDAATAPRRLNEIQRAVTSGAQLADRIEDQKETIPWRNAPVVVDPTTIPNPKKPAEPTKDIWHGQRVPGQPGPVPITPPTPKPVLRQTNSRVILGATAGFFAFSAVIGISLTQCAPPASPVPITPPPSASAESTAKKTIDPAPSATTSAIPIPSPPQSSAPSGSATASGRRTPTKNPITPPTARF